MTFDTKENFVTNIKVIFLAFEENVIILTKITLVRILYLLTAQLLTPISANLHKFPIQKILHTFYTFILCLNNISNLFVKCFGSR